jgi:hypothetical protein
VIRDGARLALIAAENAVPLVGLTIDRHRATARGLVGEDADEIKRTLFVGIETKFLVVGRVEKGTELRDVPAGYVRVNPLPQTHRVERATGGIERIVGKARPDGRELFIEGDEYGAEIGSELRL